MTVETYTMADVTSKVSAQQLLKALGILYNEYLPKAVPNYADNIQILHGDPFIAGCIFKVNFPKGSPLKYVKNRSEEIDLENLYVRYRCFEGDILGDKLHSIVIEHKAEALESGCHYMINVQFNYKNGFAMKEEELAMHKAKFKANVKSVEEYLLANPSH